MIKETGFFWAHKQNQMPDAMMHLQFDGKYLAKKNVRKNVWDIQIFRMSPLHKTKRSVVIHGWLDSIRKYTEISRFSQKLPPHIVDYCGPSLLTSNRCCFFCWWPVCCAAASLRANANKKSSPSDRRVLGTPFCLVFFTGLFYKKWDGSMVRK